MNSLLYYYNNVQKMAAYRQAKRMQRGVKLGENQVTTTATKFTTAPIQIGTGDFSVEFYGNSYGSDGNLGYSFIRYAGGSTLTNNAFNILSKAGTNGLSVVQFGNRTISSLGYVNTDENGLFHLVLTRSGVTLTIYIDGTKFNEFTMDTVSDFGTMYFLVANSRNVGFVRVWNYALSADEIAALYNNGDPMGYVVPKAMRYSKIGNYVKYRNINNALGSNTVEVEGDTYTNITITSGTSQGYPRFVVELAEKYQGAIRVEVDAEYSDEGGIIIQPVEGLSGDNNASQTITQRGIYSFTGVCNNKQYLYHSFGGALSNNKTLRLYSYKAIYCGILAEYLPQNLMESRKGPAVEPTAETYEFNIGDPYSQVMVSGRQYPFDCIYRIDFVVDEWNFIPGPKGRVGFLGLNGATALTSNGYWPTLEKAKIGEIQSYIIKMPGTGSPSLSIYGDNDTEETTARHLKVTIVGITPVSVPISWLDSAKQLPLSDEYMEPLFQSIGGYDMAANGAPEILYNE